MNEHSGNAPVYDRALLLHGAKRNEVLSLAEIEQDGHTDKVLHCVKLRLSMHAPFDRCTIFAK
jgi:hypothetical protein